MAVDVCEGRLAFPRLRLRLEDVLQVAHLVLGHDRHISLASRVSLITLTTQVSS